MSTTYLVDIDMKLSGSVASAVGSLSSAFTGLVEKAGAVVKHMAELGAVGAIGAVTYGVFHLNKELENTQISLGAIYNAKGFADGIGQGVEMAAVSVQRMRKDAAQLPGEFEDLRGILMGIATPALNAGMNIEGLHQMSANTMAVAAVMGLQMDMAAREAAQLLEGRAGAHNVLGTRLGFTGDKAQEFNKKSAEDRVKALQTEFAKYSPAIQQFGHSYEGISSSTISNVKQLLSHATSPLFESIKVTLEKINQWYDANEARLEEWAQRIGKGLNDAFQWGLTQIELWWPAVQNFATQAGTKIAEIWEKVEPLIAKAATTLREFLGDSSAMDKVIHALELYGALKVGGSLLSMGGMTTGAAVGKGALGAMGFLGNAGMTSFATLGTGASSAGLQLAAFGAAALPAIAMMTAIAAAAGGLYLAYDQGAKAVKEYGDAWSWRQGFNSKQDGGRLSNATDMSRADAIAREEAGERLLEAMYKENLARDASTSGINYWDIDYQNQMSRLIAANEKLEASLLLAAGAGLEFQRTQEERIEKQRKEDDDYYSERLTLGMGNFLAAQKKEEKKKEHPGGAGMNIGVIEIQVTSNNEPGRVAQLVFDKIANMRRNRRSSYDATQFSRT